MKVTVERAQLLKSLGHVHRVVERRNTIPILANVLIRAEKSKLGLKATDLDLEVNETIAAEVSPGGSTTVPAHMIYDIVRKLPEGSQVVPPEPGDRQERPHHPGQGHHRQVALPVGRRQQVQHQHGGHRAEEDQGRQDGRQPGGGEVHR